MWTAYIPQLTLAKTWITEGGTSALCRAEKLLARLHDLASRTHATSCLIEVLALQALLHQARRDEPAALAALEEALALAQPGRFLRLFVDLGPRLARLLFLLDLGDDEEGWDYVGEILATFPGDVTQEEPTAEELESTEPTGQAEVHAELRRGGPLPIALDPRRPRGTREETLYASGNPGEEPLTERELDVLGGFARKLTNKEIAVELGISVGTVKSHAHKVYEKLGISGRRSVVARAIDQGVLSAD